MCNKHMKWFLRKINLTVDENNLQDAVFLFGIFIFFAVIVIGLFPDKESGAFIGKDFFIYAVMTVPVIAAIYFIVISFRRNLYLDSFTIGSSFRNKMVLAFVFVAILSSLPIIFASNNFINEVLTRLAADKTSSALNVAIEMSDDAVFQIGKEVKTECKVFRYLVETRQLHPGSKTDRKTAAALSGMRGITALFFQRIVYSNNVKLIPLANMAGRKDLVAFYQGTTMGKKGRVDRLHLPGGDIIAGAMILKGHLIVFYKKIPLEIEKRSVLFSNSADDFFRLRYLREYFRDWGGIFLLSISIVVIFIAILISIYLSRNITRPIHELADAARDLSRGDFSVQLEKRSGDEIGLLVDSFNEMVGELDRNRKVLYQKQILEAWRDMARRVVHEIKNPLTPIRLSAERIKRRFDEGHPELETVINQGTETIIEEVDALRNILKEFTKFARLPEMKKESAEVKRFIENSVNVFRVHEGVDFEISVAENIPTVYVDRSLMRQAMGNILQNSIEVMEGKGKIFIDASWSSEREIIVIKISDTGPGIAGNIAMNVFKPGYTRKQKGTGLGLSIVEKIIIEHGGRVYHDPRYEAGALFVIELPVEE